MAAAQMTLVHTHGQPGDGGAAAIEQALALDPSLGEAHALRARALYREGRRDEAFVELTLALELDPDSFDVNARAGTIYYLDRQFAEAVRYYERASTLSEADFNAPAGMLSACAAIGDDDGGRRAARMALQRADEAVALDPNNAPALTVGVQASAALGQSKRARELIDQALLLDPDNFRIRYNFACVLSLYFNDADGALELLGRVFTEDPGGDYVRSARSDPDLDPIRRDSRFEGMLAAAEARLGMGR
jgi:adenylate cyclase